MESQGSSFPVLSSNEMNGFFKRMLDNLFDAVYFTDLQRRIIYWNLAAEDFTGYSAEEVVGKRCADNILMHVDETGRPFCTGERPLREMPGAGRSLHRARGRLANPGDHFGGGNHGHSRGLAGVPLKQGRSAA